MPSQPLRGRRRKTSLRAVMDAIFYLLQSGSLSLRGLRVITSARAIARRFSVTVNRKRNAETVLLIVAGPKPFSC
ncbi:transposase [Hoeflea sp. IMCC20628]|uniref:transposase n=1 Tax=Hoeflea sp. IMCC20628 TaxID=1620421 RepID=UPI001FD9DC02|nr:transposase [Hoeflea sp. IMCC20628]